LIESGQQLSRETRTWDAKSQQTHLLRSKENMLDYRFMLDPDLPELRCSSQWIGHLVDNMPELHEERIARLMQVYGLSEYDANVLASEPGAVDYFQRLVHGEDYRYVRSNKSANDAAPTFSRTPRVCCNWLTNELFGQINRARSNRAALQTSEDDDGGSRVFLLTGCVVSSKQLGGLIDLVEAGSISGKQGKQILTAMLAGDQRDAKAIAEAENFVQVSDMGLIDQLADQVWQEHRAAIVEHQTVKPNQRLPAFLTGQLIKLSKGKANPKEAAKAINQRLQQPVET
jgi:aspartyl-tRNA(Asn)/glutamyl-tRNA(Gln) amidotransferase subunit B